MAVHLHLRRAAAFLIVRYQRMSSAAKQAAAGFRNPNTLAAAVAAKLDAASSLAPFTVSCRFTSASEATCVVRDQASGESAPVTFDELVAMMVEADLALLSADQDAKIYSVPL